jgi:hypothetical protein
MIWDLERMHGVDERIGIREYETAIRTYRRLLVEVPGRQLTSVPFLISHQRVQVNGGSSQLERLESTIRRKARVWQLNRLNGVSRV